MNSFTNNPNRRTAKTVTAKTPTALQAAIFSAGFPVLKFLRIVGITDRKSPTKIGWHADQHARRAC
ncbi:hypothetical protein [Bradyrhizobium acaciae]|uniref:hypothetical protein n=1 Tax=Bradyrhizobium acaciae TaxID=2683706 RepID=UPI001E2B4DA0|nr:hypothetical protein [Bradyrhizobium acaciae]MCC8978959.1 hypothetical protein [Bradyrhizobium acaciae]